MSREPKTYRYYSNVTENNIDWLWYPYIPYGKLTIIEGDPGEGKSSFIIQVAALLTKGLPMPDGYAAQKPMNVIYQCSEDDISDTIKPRLISAGADCDRVAYIVDEEGTLSLEDERIEQTIIDTDAKLFIFDPLQSYLSQDGVIHNAVRMRGILGKLAGVAARRKCAVVLIGHMNKSSTGKTLYRGLGSIDISAIARSVLMVARDEDDSTIRYMLPIKSNLAPEGPAIGFRLGRKKGFEWIGVRQANVSIGSTISAAPIDKRGEAEDIIMSMLKDGPVPSSDIFERMSVLGLSERTAYKIKREKGILSIKQRNTWFWKLDDKG